MSRRWLRVASLALVLIALAGTQAGCAAEGTPSQGVRTDALASFCSRGGRVLADLGNGHGSEVARLDEIVSLEGAALRLARLRRPLSIADEGLAVRLEHELELAKRASRTVRQADATGAMHSIASAVRESFRAGRQARLLVGEFCKPVAVASGGSR